MNIKLKNLIIVFLTFLFSIFLLNIFIKGFETNKSDITNMNILNYIPSDYEHTILTNSTSNNIKRYINENISKQKKDKLNMLKESTLAYLGFNLQEKIENIYDDEFALTFFRNKLNKFDILLIFKLKEDKDINHIINLGEEFNKSEKIIELKRLGKLNYISHILQTKDNYIIASTNKKLIMNSLQSNNNNNKILFRDLISDDINLKEIELLSISKNIYPKINSNSNSFSDNELITIIDSEDNKIRLRSFSQNMNKINNRIINNQNDNIKDLIFTDKYSKYKQNFNYLYKDISQNEFIEEILQEVNKELLFITSSNNWVLCFKDQLPNKISIDEFNFLKNYKKEDFNINNVNYSLYTNDRLEIKDNIIIFKNENPIFSLKDGRNIFISNNLNDLLNITEKTNLSDQYLNSNDEIQPYKYILNDIFFIKHINNKQLFKYYEPLKNLQYFINTELFSLEDININISHTIPEQKEKVYLESNLKIL